MENTELTTAFGAGEELNAANDAKKEEKKRVTKALQADFLSKVEDNPTFKEVLRTESASLEVVHTLGYGKGGGLIRKGEGPYNKDEKRELEQTPKIVGYEVKNVGDKPITYRTEVWSLDEATGKYVASEAELSIAPGETVNLTRKYMSMLCARPEFSFTLRNGIMINGSSKKCKTADEKLAAFHFKFNPEEKKNVNSDSVKLSIDEEDESGNRVIKANYVSVFGFLNNPEEKKERGKQNSTKFTTQDLLANYAMELINGEDILAKK